MNKHTEILIIKASAFDCIEQAFQNGEFEDIKYYITNAQKKLKEYKDEIQGK